MPIRLGSLVPALASALLLAAACDKPADDKKADAKQTDAKQADAKQTTDVLTLGPAKLIAKDKPDEAIVLAADGSVTMAGETLIKISSDGKLSKPDGTLLGEVGPDGVVKFDGKPIGVTLLDDGASVSIPDGTPTTFRFAADGTLNIDPKPPETEAMTSEGCTGPVAKTCALVLMVFVLRSESDPAPPTRIEVPVQPAVAAPAPAAG